MKKKIRTLAFYLKQDKLNFNNRIKDRIYMIQTIVLHFKIRSFHQCLKNL